jgi:GPH family glycoside/pentoside/hexuronide:cation symporter
MAIGLGLSLGLLALVGFDATATTHSDTQLMALRLLYIIGPVILYMAAFAVAWKYPLTADRQERIHQWVVRRNARLQLEPQQP